MTRSTLSWTLVALVSIALLAGCTLNANPAPPTVEGTPAAGNLSGTDLPAFPTSMMTPGGAGAPTSSVPQPKATTPPKPTASGGQAQPTAQVPAAGTPAATVAATATSVPATAVPAATSGSGGTAATDYTVQPGDNLYRIALAYNMSWTTVAAYNNIAWPYFVYVGQVIHIPATTGGQPPAASGSTYTVKPGDNLFRIALAYNLPYTTLAAFNNIPYPYYVFPGQVLNIP